MKAYKFGRDNHKFRKEGKSFSIGDHPKLRAQQRFGWDFEMLKEKSRKALDQGDQYEQFHLYEGKLFLFNQRRGGKGGVRLVTVMDFAEYIEGEYA